MNKQTLKSIFSYFVGNMSSKLLSVVLIPIFAYFVSADDLGSYDYFSALLNIIVPISFINIWDAELKYIIKNNQEDRKTYITNSFCIMIFGQLFLVGISLILRSFNLLESRYLVLSYGYFSVFGWLFFFQYLCRGFKNNKLYIASSLCSTVIHIVLIAILVIWLQTGFIGLIISDIITNIIVCILLLIKTDFYAFIDFSLLNKRIIKSIGQFSIPLTINVVSVWLTSGISKVIVTKLVSSYANGIYSFGNRFAVIITTVGTVVNMALLEEAYSYKTLEEFRKKTRQLISELSKYYISLVIILIPVISIIFEIALGKTEYYSSKELVPAFMVLSVINILGGIVGNAFTVTGKTNRLFICSIVGAVFNISIGLLLINELSYYGVLLAQLAGIIMTVAAKSLFAFKETKLKINWTIIVIGSAISLGLGYISSTSNIIINCVILFASIICIAIWNRRELKKGFQLIIKRRPK